MTGEEILMQFNTTHLEYMILQEGCNVLLVFFLKMLQHCWLCGASELNGIVQISNMNSTATAGDKHKSSTQQLLMLHNEWIVPFGIISRLSLMVSRHSSKFSNTEQNELPGHSRDFQEQQKGGADLTSCRSEHKSHSWGHHHQYFSARQVFGSQCGGLVVGVLGHCW